MSLKTESIMPNTQSSLYLFPSFSPSTWQYTFFWSWMCSTWLIRSNQNFLKEKIRREDYKKTELKTYFWILSLLCHIQCLFPGGIQMPFSKWLPQVFGDFITIQEFLLNLHLLLVSLISLHTHIYRQSPKKSAFILNFRIWFLFFFLIHKLGPRNFKERKRCFIEVPKWLEIVCTYKQI